MQSDKTKWERKRLPISQLRPHPAQTELYEGTTSSVEDETFARKLRDQGQRDEVHVMPRKNKAGLPPGTVLDGWRRTQAAKSNGETQIDCYIRNDLADATATEIATEFAGFNFDRRQLSPLARARCAKFLLTAQAGSSGRLGTIGIEKLKKQVADLLCVEIRTVNRYLAILRGPLAVQQAFDRGEVSQVDAAKIGTLCEPSFGKLTKQQQEDLANRIAGGESAQAVVREYITACQDPNITACRAERKQAMAEDDLIRLAHVIRDLEKNASAIEPDMVLCRLSTLRKGKQVIDRLLAQV